MGSEKIEIYTLDDDDIEQSILFFDQDEFYFGTKRPDTTNRAIRRKNLTNSIGLAYNGKLMGFAKVVADKKNLYSIIQVAFTEKEYYHSATAAVLLKKFMDQVKIQNHYGKILIEAYQFHQDLIDLCEKVGFQRKGALRNKIYKYGKYFDSYLYEYEED